MTAGRQFAERAPSTPPREAGTPPAFDLVDVLNRADVADAARAAQEVIVVEDRLAADNLLAPYADRLPPALAATSVAPGSVVEVTTDFEQRHGPVAQAMACGPSLVRDGALDLDCEAEHFGQQDIRAISFFLPRTIETHRAARSFLGRRGDTLVLGTVSETVYGHGAAGYSAGMTFGELAQLALDLDFDSAYALDGSSSLVARAGGRVRVLNAPTGGADVAAGVERYINTHWLVHGR
ncbi:MAG: phosphodiester glycosidase family protein [Actinomycetota bacterium]|nr:phosphodiester glycosidase family protein [Actinomycetota bacterium]